MPNSVKTLNFIISLIVYLIYYTLAEFALTAANVQPSPEAAPYLVNTIAVIGFYVVLFAQAFFRRIYSYRYLSKAVVILTYRIKAFRFYDRLLIYLFPAIGFFIPIVQGGSFNTNNLITLGFFILFIAATELIFKLNAGAMKLYATDSGFGIEGFDLRLDLPIPNNYPNGSGFYSFERIEAYQAAMDRILLYQSFDLGVITIPCEGEANRQLKALLISKRVPEKRKQF